MKNFKLLMLLTVMSTSVAFATQDYSVAYDPTRDPYIDFESASKDALAQHKLLLIEVGGEWCIWCKRLDKFILDNKEIEAAFSDTFIKLKVNVSEENKNENFLKQFPKIPGYPHFIVVNVKDKTSVSENTNKLEEGKGYSKKSFTAFINRWKDIQKKQQ